VETRHFRRKVGLIQALPFHSPPVMSDSSSCPIVTVIGSLNLDTILSVPCIAQPGATVAATSWESRYGGKGANQAIAACRQGAQVNLIGCVGEDAGGRACRAYLAEQGINVDGVQRLESVQTGRAYVCVDPKGTNTIVTASGANGYLGAEMVLHQHAALESADVVICQLEVPLEATISALQRAAELGKITILNPSPMNSHFPWGQVPVDFLIVNENEAAALLGYQVESTKEAPTIRSQMADLAVGTLIITRGHEHTYLFNSKQALKVPPPAVDAVDTTGAGDAFTGAFAVHYAETHDLLGSVRKANIAGAIACTRLGAQDAIPMRQEVDDFGKSPEELAPPPSNEAGHSGDPGEGEAEEVPA
jgi:ribokinase